MSILTRSNEIQEILNPFLQGTHELINLIIQIEKGLNHRESMQYWNYMYHNSVYFINPYFKRLRKPPGYLINIHEQIHRMNGSLESVRIENEEIKKIRISNDNIAKGWRKLRLLPKK